MSAWSLAAICFPEEDAMATPAKPKPPGGTGDEEFGAGSEMGRIWPDQLLVAPGWPNAARHWPPGQEKTRHYPDSAGGPPGGGLGPPPGEA